MKTVGIVGGMTWESSLEYYKLINELVAEKIGGHHSAKILLDSLDFEDIYVWEHSDQWELMEDCVFKSIYNLEKAGVDFTVISSNTTHKVMQNILPNITKPFLHIAQPTGEKIVSCNMKKVGLLGTSFTMEQDFYKGFLSQNFDIECIVPTQACDRKFVHDVIMQELCYGVISEKSKERYLGIIDKMVAQGAEGIILGCTEIPLLISQQDTSTVLFDTTRLHIEKIVSLLIE